MVLTKKKAMPMTTLDILTLEDLQQFKKELFTELRYLKGPDAGGSLRRKWLRSAEVREMLNISPGTLQNLRINGQLPFTKVGNLMYYKLQDIERILEKGLLGGER